MNVVAARRHEGWWVSSNGTRLVEADPGAEDAAQIGFRAEHVEINGGEVEGTVQQVADLGATRVLLVKWAGEIVHVVAGRDASARQGDPIRPRIHRDRVSVWRAG
jgi:ABC-type sugar transport system ATPase subunit